VLTMELQRGIVGDLSRIPDLAAAVARAGVIERAASLASAARTAGVRVVHCTAVFRSDLAGTGRNAPLLAAMTRDPSHILEGTDGAALVPELGPDPADLVIPRYSGVSPFIGTSLDAVLRNLGVSTVVATGVSLNLAIVGLCIEAVNLGYRVCVATDAVAGVPEDYAASVLATTVPLLATRLTTTEIAALWR